MATSAYETATSTKSDIVRVPPKGPLPFKGRDRVRMGFLHNSGSSLLYLKLTYILSGK